MPISLSKGQSIDLSKERPGLSRITMGLGWDAVKKKGFFGGLLGGGAAAEIDLDASCLVFDAQGLELDAIWFRQLTSRDGSIVHTGDNLTGEGDGDDEQIRVDLSRLPSQVAALVFTVNSFRGQTFDEVDNAFCRIVDEAGDHEICRFTLAEKGRHTGVLMAVVSRASGQWRVAAIGEPVNGRTVADMVPAAKRHLAV